MNSNMLLFAPLCFLLCWMLPGDSMGVPLNVTSQDANQPVPLSLAEDAVDDMYFGCKQIMTEMVKNEYFEMENNEMFAYVWKNAELCAEKKLKKKYPKDEALTKNHMKAICAYTAEYENFYGVFNDHIRNDRSIYGTSFPYHSIHFWLTSALQILNGNNKCHTTYRRTSREFTGEANQKMRFGFFASSSYKTTLTNFGHKTCFKIRTCLGADLKHYSVFGDVEQEVLIPPYEVFKITGKKEGRDVEGLEDCEVVYSLKSIDFLSNLNCKALNS